MSTLRARRSGPVEGVVRVPGDKSIAHRLLLLAGLATGASEIVGLPSAGDVRSTLSCLSALLPDLRPELQAWNSKSGVPPEARGFTSDGPRPRAPIRIPGRGRSGLAQPDSPLDCGNSGTTMRLLLGVLAAAPWSSDLVGDPSLSRRPMERVARPLREMGALVETADGHAPVRIEGRALHGIRHTAEVPSAQVKGAILLAGLAASGATEVIEPVPTRDHTERLLGALGLRAGMGAAVRGGAEVSPFAAEVPGDPSGAAFLAAAALVTGGRVRILDLGLNPTRLRFAEVLTRLGARVDFAVERDSLGEPIGVLEVSGDGGVAPVDLSPGEVAEAIDEIPILAVVAALGEGPSRFRGVTELRVKESDRVEGIVRTIRSLGGAAEVEGDDLVVGGGGLVGGTVDPSGDHRLAMASTVGGLASDRGAEVLGAECAAISFPGFPEVLHAVGADVEGS